MSQLHILIRTYIKQINNVNLMLIIGGFSSESKDRSQWFLFVGSSSTVTTVQIRKLSVRCVYDTDLTYALRIENTSEGEPSTYEATNTVTTEENPRKFNNNL